MSLPTVRNPLHDEENKVPQRDPKQFRTVDADTSDHRETEERVRLAGMDAPELRTPEGRIARDFADENSERFSELDRMGYDMYGRTVGHLRDPETGESLSAFLVRQGHGDPVDYTRQGVQDNEIRSALNARAFENANRQAEEIGSRPEFVQRAMMRRTPIGEAMAREAVERRESYRQSLGSELTSGAQMARHQITGSYWASLAAVGDLLANNREGREPLSSIDEGSVPRDELTVRDRVTNWMQRTGMRNYQAREMQMRNMDYTPVAWKDVKDARSFGQWAFGTIGQIVPDVVDSAIGGLVGAGVGAAIGGPVGAVKGGALGLRRRAGESMLMNNLRQSMTQDAIRSGVPPVAAQRLAHIGSDMAYRSAIRKGALTGAAWGARTGAFGVGASQFGGSSYTEIFNEFGVRAPATALTVGAAAGATEVLGLEYMLRKMFGSSLNSKNFAKSVLAMTGVGAAAQGSTEVLQEAMMVAGKEINNPDFDGTPEGLFDLMLKPENRERYIEALAAGILYGGVFGAAGGGLRGTYNTVQDYLNDPDPAKAAVDSLNGQEKQAAGETAGQVAQGAADYSDITGFADDVVSRWTDAMGMGRMKFRVADDQQQARDQQQTDDLGLDDLVEGDDGATAPTSGTRETPQSPPPGQSVDPDVEDSFSDNVSEEGDQQAINDLLNSLESEQADPQALEDGTTSTDSERGDFEQGAGQGGVNFSRRKRHILGDSDNRTIWFEEGANSDDPGTIVLSREFADELHKLKQNADGKSTKERVAVIERLGHEFGEAFKQAKYQALPETAKQAIERDYENYKRNKSKEPSKDRQFIDTLTQYPLALADIVKRRGIDKFTQANIPEDYTYSYDEWFSNEVAKYLMQGENENIHSAETRSFIKDFAETVKTLYETLKLQLVGFTQGEHKVTKSNLGTPSAEVVGFLNYMLREQNVNAEGNVVTLSKEQRASAEQYAKKHGLRQKADKTQDVKTPTKGTDTDQTISPPTKEQKSRISTLKDKLKKAKVELSDSVEAHYKRGDYERYLSALTSLANKVEQGAKATSEEVKSGVSSTVTQVDVVKLSDSDYQVYTSLINTLLSEGKRMDKSQNLPKDIVGEGKAEIQAQLDKIQEVLEKGETSKLNDLDKKRLAKKLNQAKVDLLEPPKTKSSAATSSDSIPVYTPETADQFGQAPELVKDTATDWLGAFGLSIDTVAVDDRIGGGSDNPGNLGYITSGEGYRALVISKSGADRLQKHVDALAKAQQQQQQQQTESSTETDEQRAEAERTHVLNIIDTLSHEVGHVIDAELLQHDKSPVARKVVAAYKEWLSAHHDLAKGTVSGLLKTLFSRQGGTPLVFKAFVSMDANKQLDESPDVLEKVGGKSYADYALDYREWVADQLSLYLKKKGFSKEFKAKYPEATTLIQDLVNWFKERLKDFFAKYGLQTKDSYLDPAVEAWADGMVKRAAAIREATGASKQKTDTQSDIDREMDEASAEFSAAGESTTTTTPDQEQDIQPPDIKAKVYDVWWGDKTNKEKSHAIFSTKHPITLQNKGKTFYSIEHAYQAMKSGVFDEALDAKYRAEGNRQHHVGEQPARTDLVPKTGREWHLEILYQLMLKAYRNNKELAHRLVATGDAEFSHKHGDPYWQEHYPQLLKDVRQALIDEGIGQSETGSVSDVLRIPDPKFKPFKWLDDRFDYSETVGVMSEEARTKMLEDVRKYLAGFYDLVRERVHADPLETLVTDAVKYRGTLTDKRLTEKQKDQMVEDYINRITSTQTAIGKERPSKAIAADPAVYGMFHDKILSMESRKRKFILAVLPALGREVHKGLQTPNHELVQMAVEAIRWDIAVQDMEAELIQLRDEKRAHYERVYSAKEEANPFTLLGDLKLLDHEDPNHILNNPFLIVLLKKLQRIGEFTETYSTLSNRTDYVYHQQRFFRTEAGNAINQLASAAMWWNLDDASGIGWRGRAAQNRRTAAERKLADAVVYRYAVDLSRALGHDFTRKANKHVGKDVSVRLDKLRGEVIRFIANDKKGIGMLFTPDPSLVFDHEQFAGLEGLDGDGVNIYKDGGDHVIHLTKQYEEFLLKFRAFLESSGRYNLNTTDKGQRFKSIERLLDDLRSDMTTADMLDMTPEYMGDLNPDKDIRSIMGDIQDAGREVKLQDDRDLDVDRDDFDAGVFEDNVTTEEGQLSAEEAFKTGEVDSQQDVLIPVGYYSRVAPHHETEMFFNAFKKAHELFRKGLEISGEKGISGRDRLVFAYSYMLKNHNQLKHFGIKEDRKAEAAGAGHKQDGSLKTRSMGYFYGAAADIFKGISELRDDLREHILSRLQDYKAAMTPDGRNWINKHAVLAMLGSDVKTIGGHENFKKLENDYTPNLEANGKYRFRFTDKTDASIVDDAIAAAFDDDLAPVDKAEADVSTDKLEALVKEKQGARDYLKHLLEKQDFEKRFSATGETDQRSITLNLELSADKDGIFHAYVNEPEAKTKRDVFNILPRNLQMAMLERFDLRQYRDLNTTYRFELTEEKTGDELFIEGDSNQYMVSVNEVADHLPDAKEMRFADTLNSAINKMGMAVRQKENDIPFRPLISKSVYGMKEAIEIAKEFNKQRPKPTDELELGAMEDGAFIRKLFAERFGATYQTVLTHLARHFRIPGNHSSTTVVDYILNHMDKDGNITVDYFEGNTAYFPSYSIRTLGQDMISKDGHGTSDDMQHYDFFAYGLGLMMGEVRLPVTYAPRQDSALVDKQGNLKTALHDDLSIGTPSDPQTLGDAKTRRERIGQLGERVRIATAKFLKVRDELGDSTELIDQRLPTGETGSEGGSEGGSVATLSGIRYYLQHLREYKNNLKADFESALQRITPSRKITPKSDTSAWFRPQEQAPGTRSQVVNSLIKSRMKINSMVGTLQELKTIMRNIQKLKDTPKEKAEWFGRKALASDIKRLKKYLKELNELHSYPLASNPNDNAKAYKALNRLVDGLADAKVWEQSNFSDTKGAQIGTLLKKLTPHKDKADKLLSETQKIILQNIEDKGTRDALAKFYSTEFREAYEQSNENRIKIKEQVQQMRDKLKALNTRDAAEFAQMLNNWQKSLEGLVEQGLSDIFTRLHKGEFVSHLGAGSKFSQRFLDYMDNKNKLSNALAMFNKQGSPVIPDNLKTELQDLFEFARDTLTKRLERFEVLDDIIFANQRVYNDLVGIRVYGDADMSAAVERRKKLDAGIEKAHKEFTSNYNKFLSMFQDVYMNDLPLFKDTDIHPDINKHLRAWFDHITVSVQRGIYIGVDKSRDKQTPARKKLERLADYIDYFLDDLPPKDRARVAELVEFANKNIIESAKLLDIQRYQQRIKDFRDSIKTKDASEHDKILSEFYEKEGIYKGFAEDIAEEGTKGVDFLDTVKVKYLDAVAITEALEAAIVEHGVKRADLAYQPHELISGYKEVLRSIEAEEELWKKVIDDRNHTKFQQRLSQLKANDNTGRFNEINYDPDLTVKQNIKQLQAQYKDFHDNLVALHQEYYMNPSPQLYTQLVAESKYLRGMNDAINELLLDNAGLTNTYYQANKEMQDATNEYLAAIGALHRDETTRTTQPEHVTQLFSVYNLDDVPGVPESEVDPVFDSTKKPKETRDDRDLKKYFPDSAAANREKSDVWKITRALDRLGKPYSQLAESSVFGKALRPVVRMLGLQDTPVYIIDSMDKAGLEALIRSMFGDSRYKEGYLLYQQLQQQLEQNPDNSFTLFAENSAFIFMDKEATDGFRDKADIDHVPEKARKKLFHEVAHVLIKGRLNAVFYGDPDRLTESERTLRDEINRSAGKTGQIDNPIEWAANQLDRWFQDRIGQLQTDSAVEVKPDRWGLGSLVDSLWGRIHNFAKHLKLVGRDYSNVMHNVFDAIVLEELSSGRTIIKGEVVPFRKLSRIFSSVDTSERNKLVSEVNASVGSSRDMFKEQLAATREAFYAKAGKGLVDVIRGTDDYMQKMSLHTPEPVIENFHVDFQDAYSRVRANETLQAVGGAIKDMGLFLHGKITQVSHTWIRTQKSPEGERLKGFQAIAELFRPDTGVSRLGRFSISDSFHIDFDSDRFREAYFPAVRRLHGTFVHTRLDGIMKAIPLKGKARNDRLKEIRMEHLTGNITSREARQVQDLIKDIQKYAHKHMPLLRNSTDNKLPLVLDPIKVESMQAKFKQMLTDNGLNADEVNQVYESFKNTSGVFDIARLGEVMPTGTKFTTTRASRIDDIPQEQFEPFMNDNYEAMLYTYAHEMIKRAEFERLMGGWVVGESRNLILPDRIIDSHYREGRGWYVTYRTSRGQATARATWDHTALYKALRQNAYINHAATEQIRQLDDTMHHYMGRLGSGMSQGARSVQSTLMVWLNYMVLPLSVFSQAVDFGNPVIRTNGNIKQAWNGFRLALRAFKEKDANMYYRMAAVNGLVMNTYKGQVMANYFDSPFLTGKAAIANEALFRYNGMMWLNNLHGIYVTATGIETFKEWADRNDPESRALLKQFDITPEEVKAWVTAKQPVYVEGDERTKQWHKINTALNRFTYESSLRPDASQRPNWMGMPQFALIAHLKPFYFSFHDIVLRRAYREYKRMGTPQKKAMMAALPLIALMPIALVGTTMREMLRYGLPWQESRPDWQEKTSWETTLHYVNRAGLLGPTQMLLDAYNAESFGSNAIGSLAGPTLNHLLVNFPNQDFDRWLVNSLPAMPLLPTERAWVQDKIPFGGD